MSQPTETVANAWLHQTRLDRQRFKTRKDALESLTLALQMPGAIKPGKKPTCEKIQSGHYRLAGKLSAVRKANRNDWTILAPDGREVGHAQSLWRAAWIAEERAGKDIPHQPQIRGH